MPNHTDDREGILGLLDKIANTREGIGNRLKDAMSDTGRQLAVGANLIDRAMRFVGDNPLEFLPGTAEAIALGESRGFFDEGRPGMGLLALAGAVPSIPKPTGLFAGLGPLRKKGLRVFARAEGPGVRRVISITPNTRPGEKAVRGTILEETAGNPPVVKGHVQFDSVDEAVGALSGGERTGNAARADLEGYSEIPVGREELMEGRYERVAERGLFPGTATDPAQARARAGARKSESVGGFKP